MSACAVLICGAGASGLTMAIELARRGIAFRLIDRAEIPFHGSRGKGIQPRTQEIFEDLGVIDRMTAAGGPYPPVRHYDGAVFRDSPFAPVASPTPEEPYVQLLMLAQFRTESILRARLAELGGVVEFGHELVDFEQDATGVTAEIRRGSSVETVRVGYLVAADGGRSFVRERLGIPFSGETRPVRSIVADIDVVGLEDSFWHRWGTTPADTLMISPLRGTDLFQLQAPIGLDDDPDLSPSGLSALVAERTGRDDIEIRSVAWSSAYGTNLRVAARFREGRIFLVGDAAHVHPPTGGQGLNTSVQDAYNLAWKLAAVIDGWPEDLLDTYELERQPIAHGVIKLSGRLLDSMRSDGEFRRGRENHQLDLTYRGSPLATDHDARERRTMSGDRAPDAPCLRASGLPCRLFELFRGPHWTLLATDMNVADLPRGLVGLHVHAVGPNGDVLDSKGHIARAYDLGPGDWVLIRPDGYVAATGQGARFEAIKALGFRALACW
jgi:2-polyprenyl-6-methoxyphenol hydroxylase-like FAD-dependent oxidoreductase